MRFYHSETETKGKGAASPFASHIIEEKGIEFQVTVQKQQLPQLCGENTRMFGGTETRKVFSDNYKWSLINWKRMKSEEDPTLSQFKTIVLVWNMILGPG